MGADERERVSSAVCVSPLEGSEGATPSRARAAQRRKDDGRARDGHHRLRPEVLRAAAEAVPAEPGNGEAVREQSGDGGSHGEAQLEPAGRLPDHGGACARSRSRADVRLRSREGGRGVLRRGRSEQAASSLAAAPLRRGVLAAVGHEKGAFTGAIQRRIGRFESADGGTLFLDEIGELPPETQVALLRALQERTFERIGGLRPVAVDVRVLTATNRDLDAAIAEGSFRKDLFYRLNVFPVHVPALRERGADIPLLVEYLVARYAQKTGKRIQRIGNETMDLFKRYSWPGNVRELQNVIERAVILCDGETFSVDASWFGERSKSPVRAKTLASDLSAHEKTMIENALRQSSGRVSGANGAAAILGMPRQTLESKLRRLGIKPHHFRAS